MRSPQGAAALPTTGPSGPGRIPPSTGDLGNGQAVPADDAEGLDDVAKALKHGADAQLICILDQKFRIVVVQVGREDLRAVADATSEPRVVEVLNDSSRRVRECNRYSLRHWLSGPVISAAEEIR